MMDQEQGPRHSRIGEILKELGYVTDQELKEALAYQRTHKGMRLGKAMMELELISEEQMLKALGMLRWRKCIRRAPWRSRPYFAAGH